MDKLFPKIIDNNYQGSKIAIIIFFVVNIIKFLMGLNISGLNPFIDNVHILKEVDKIPLDDFPQKASQLIIDSSASWALLLLIMSILGFLILIRYRAMLPIMFLTYLLEQIGRQFLNYSEKFKNSDFVFELSMANMINFGLSFMLLLGLILSIYRPFKNKIQ